MGKLPLYYTKNHSKKKALNSYFIKVLLVFMVEFSLNFLVYL